MARTSRPPQGRPHQLESAAGTSASPAAGDSYGFCGEAVVDTLAAAKRRLPVEQRRGRPVAGSRVEYSSKLRIQSFAFLTHSAYRIHHSEFHSYQDAA